MMNVNYEHLHNTMSDSFSRYEKEMERKKTARETRGNARENENNRMTVITEITL